MATIKEKRKKIEDMVLNAMSKIDKTLINTNRWKSFFKSMNDKQFETWIKNFLKDEQENYYMEFLPYKNEPVLQDLIDCGKFLNIPLEEYVYYRHDGNKNNPVRTAYKVPVGYVYLRKYILRFILVIVCLNLSNCWKLLTYNDEDNQQPRLIY